MRRTARRIQAPSGRKTDRAVKTTKQSTHHWKACLRPNRSARRPQTMEPMTVPRPEQARMIPAETPVRCQAEVRRETTNPIRNISKNSDMFPAMASPMMLF